MPPLVEMDMSGLKDLVELHEADDPEETTEEEKEMIDQETVQDLLNKHDDVPPISPLAVQTRVQLIETVRWTLAMNDVYDIETRRQVAQEKVASHHEPTNSGTGEDREDDESGITVQAVQKKIRKVFDGRYGRKNAQEHFDEVLEDIEDAYKTRIEMV